MTTAKILWCTCNVDCQTLQLTKNNICAYRKEAYFPIPPHCKDVSAMRTYTYIIKHSSTSASA